MQLSSHQQYGKTDAHPSVLVPASNPTLLLFQILVPFCFSPGLIPSEDQCRAVPLSVQTAAGARSNGKVKLFNPHLVLRESSLKLWPGLLYFIGWPQSFTLLESKMDWVKRE